MVCSSCSRPEGQCSDVCPTLAKRVLEVVASFPATFGLRGFRGETFRASARASYASGGAPMIYTERLGGDGTWSDFAKGREAELRAELLPAPTPGPRVRCGCGDGRCMLCDDDGMVPTDEEVST